MSLFARRHPPSSLVFNKQQYTFFTVISHVQKREYFFLLKSKGSGLPVRNSSLSSFCFPVRSKFFCCTSSKFDFLKTNGKENVKSTRIEESKANCVREDKRDFRINGYRAYDCASVNRDGDDSKSLPSKAQKSVQGVLSHPAVEQGGQVYAWSMSKNFVEKKVEVSCILPRFKWRVTSSEDSHQVRLQQVNRKLWLRPRLRDFGMPRGYPDSVEPGYRRFFYLNLLQTFTTFFTQSIGTQAILGGFFAALTPQLCMVKDLLPALLASYLANRVSAYETFPKVWFTCSQVLIQISAVCELLIPVILGVPYFLLASIVTGLIKQNANLMYSTSRASIQQHFAIHKNFGELQRQSNAYGTVVLTSASALGILFVTLVPSFTAQCVVALTGSVVSIALAYSAVRPLTLRILTPASAEIALKHYIDSGYKSVPSPGELGVLRRDEYVQAHLDVNPALMSLQLEGHTREECTRKSVLLAHPNLQFTIGLWSVHEGLVKRIIRPCSRSKHLVLYIHEHCTAEQLLCAYLLCIEGLRLSQQAEQEKSGAFEETLRKSFFSLQEAFVGLKSKAVFHAKYAQLRHNWSNELFAEFVAEARLEPLIPNRTNIASFLGKEASVETTDSSSRVIQLADTLPCVARAAVYKTAVLCVLLRRAGWDLRVNWIDNIGMRVRSCASTAAPAARDCRIPLTAAAAAAAAYADREGERELESSRDDAILSSKRVYTRLEAAREEGAQGVATRDFSFEQEEKQGQEDDDDSSDSCQENEINADAQPQDVVSNIGLGLKTPQRHNSSFASGNTK